MNDNERQDYWMPSAKQGMKAFLVSAGIALLLLALLGGTIALLA